MTWSTHYIDDFLTIGKTNSTECRSNLEVMLEICSWLGVPLKEDKLEGPSTELTFLCIILDTTRGEIRLPEQKLEELKQLISTWRDKRACKKRELLSLIGKLSHACKVVQAGRIFLRRMIDTSMKARNSDHWVRFYAEFQADLMWWEGFLSSWNARSMMDVHRPQWIPTVTFALTLLVLGDVWQYGNRCGSNNLGLVIGQGRVLQPKNWFRLHWHVQFGGQNGVISRYWCGATTWQ